MPATSAPETATHAARAGGRAIWGTASAILPGVASPRTYAVLAALGALISGFSLLRGIDPFDEGLMLQAANRIAEGELPYRDFLYPYGPGQPFLLAGLQEIFGPSLLVWRVVRLLVDVAVPLVAFWLARREA